VLLDHLEFGRRLLHGEDVHGPWRSDPDAPVRPLHAPYPPSFGLLTAPFASIHEVFGLRAARCAWALLQIGCLFAAAVVLRRRLMPRAPPGAGEGYWHLLWLGVFLLAMRFVLRDTHGGGGNLVNLALCLLAFDDAERGKTRRAGLWLGFSIATKPTQVWLLLGFAVMGRWRAAGWAVLTGAGAVLVTLLLQRFDVLPWLWWIEGSWRLATQADPFAAPALDFPKFEWMNQSLRFAVARWTGTVPDEFAALVPFGVPPGLGLGTPAVAWLVRGVSALLLSATMITAWRTRGSQVARTWIFAAWLVLSLLLSPLSWKAHHVALVPVLSLLLQQRRWYVLTAWALCCVPGGELIGDDAAEWFNSTYVVTAWDVVLLVVALRAARSAANEDREAALPSAGLEPSR
jgi:hypothetical protein